MTSLFEQLGGAKALHAVVDAFYDRILADAELAPFFTDVEMPRQKAKQRAFLAWVLGGTDHYTGKDMREAHAHLLERGLNDDHVTGVINHLAGTLADRGVDAGSIGQVGELAESVRDDVLGRPKAADG
jgi:hemoglobin